MNFLINNVLKVVMKNQQKFGLFTSICMVVGIVIGSGIFFKSDSVLVYTNGNVLLGVVVFVIAAMAIIFGSLTIAELAVRTDEAGGIIAYADKYIGKRAGCVFGWFQNFIYFPTLIAVVSWVVGIYFCILFGIDGSFEFQIVIGIVTFAILYGLHYVSTKVAGIFQNMATIIKLIPIFLCIFAALVFGNPDFTVLNSYSPTTASWIAAIGPIAFTYDGWIIATNLSHEIKDSQRNLRLAFIIGPIFILLAYVLYFVSISLILDPQTIMQSGAGYVDILATQILGDFGSKIFLAFIVISILGTLNGLILGSSRGLYALGKNKLIPNGEKLAIIHEKWDTPTNAILASCALTSIWLVVHFITTKFQILGNSDISEIAIVTMYIMYVVLYVQVMKLKAKGEIKSVVRGYIIPFLAIIGSLFIFFGGMQDSMFWLYSLFSLLVIIVAYLYARKNIV